MTPSKQASKQVSKHSRHPTTFLRGGSNQGQRRESSTISTGQVLRFASWARRERSLNHRMKKAGGGHPVKGYETHLEHDNTPTHTTNKPAALQSRLVVTQNVPGTSPMDGRELPLYVIPITPPDERLPHISANPGPRGPERPANGTLPPCKLTSPAEHPSHQLARELRSKPA